MKYEYQILSIEPDPTRGERVNVGLVIYGETIDVRYSSTLPKIKGIDPRITPTILSDAVSTLKEIANKDQEGFRNLANEIGSIRTGELGWFVLDDKTKYDEKVKDLMERFVYPPRAIYRRTPASGSKLASQLRSAFRSNQWLGSKPDDIYKHKIVSSFEIEHQEGLRADFALKNGSYLMMMVADFTAKSTRQPDRLKVAALKSIAMMKARQKMQANSSVIYAIAANEESAETPSLSMLEEFSDGQMFNALSQEDMSKFHREISEKLERPILVS